MDMRGQLHDPTALPYEKAIQLVIQTEGVWVSESVWTLCRKEKAVVSHENPRYSPVVHLYLDIIST
jgi:hypothetical protein